MDALLFGISLGFVSGISPGPLMTLVLSASLQRGFRAGALTAMAPLLTDVPVILLSLVVLQRVPEWFLTVLTLAGGAFVIFLGVRTIADTRTNTMDATTGKAGSGDLVRAALVNLLNPHPWLFWVTVGSPFLIRSWGEAPWRALAFLLSFLGLLVGTKVVIAWGAARGRRFMSEPWYRLVIAACGALLVALGLLLVWQALASWP
jgi:threonine/homoserine/homoserine lactone efflux protein